MRCSELDSRWRKFQQRKRFRCAGFEIRLRLAELAPCCPVLSSSTFEEATMGRGILLWLLGVPIPVIILLWLFFGR
jgi:hypothetical protein